ncbi:hypothetical protein D3C73_444900 [compost metagenome]
MWIGLLWIIGVYGTSIALLHMIYGTRSRKPKRAARVLIITHNNATQIEWYIRSLFFFSRIKGRELIATVLDEGSSDETMKITERLSHSHKLNVEVCSAGNTVDDFLKAHEEEDIILVHISNRDELMKIPAF